MPEVIELYEQADGSFAYEEPPVFKAVYSDEIPQWDWQAQADFAAGFKEGLNDGD